MKILRHGGRFARVTAALIALTFSFFYHMTSGFSSADNNRAESEVYIILSRPTKSEITVSISSENDMLSYVEWGTDSEEPSHKSDVKTAKMIQPAFFVMDNLKGNTKYYYTVHYQKDGASHFSKEGPYSFMTPRDKGNDYTFVIQADSHLQNRADEALYKLSMQKMAMQVPDFLFDLGDTFINDQSGNRGAQPGADVLNRQSLDTVREKYLQQLPYFSLVARQAPLFLVLGNHDGEFGYLFDQTEDSLGVKSNMMRKTYFPNPVSNEFYKGNVQSEPFVGAPENYYSFEWGDALFVALDVYRYITVTPSDSPLRWDWSLGEAQYEWFKETLKSSSAKYKFVFAHHASGSARGAKEIVNLFEWGGQDRTGTYRFDIMRPGWGKPVHQIMKESGVTIFFQGHDHLFAMEEIDGVIYQTVPKPAESAKDPRSFDESYTSGDKLVNSGFLKIDVGKENVKVDYLRNYCMLTDASQDDLSGVAYSYTVDDNRNVRYLKRDNDDFGKYGTPSAKPSYLLEPVDIEAPSTEAPGEGGIDIYADGEQIVADPPPFLDENGRTQVPLRFVAEAMGALVLWEENNKADTVTIKKGSKVIEMEIGAKTVLINGSSEEIDTVPTLREGRTFVPLRFVSEMLGAVVDWDDKTKRISIEAPLENGTLLSYPIVHTGVTSFYSATNKITEPKKREPYYGQDAHNKKNMPSYTDNGDGTITDNVTGLMWQKDMGAKIDLEEAVKKAKGLSLGGYADWRVPTIKELYSLILFTGESSGENAKIPYIDTDYFIQPLGNTADGEREIDAQTISSTVYTGVTMNNNKTVFGVNFIDGRIKGYPKNKKMYVRLVRGNEDYGKNVLVDNGDGTISDLATGLMWQRSDSGVGMNWKDALSYADDLELAGNDDWRLPNAKELQSIVEYSRSLQATDSPAIDPLFICSSVTLRDGRVDYPYYWTSTTHLDGQRPYGNAVYIAFGEALGQMNGRLLDVHGAGAQRSDPKEGNPNNFPAYMGPQGDLRVVFNYVRCVRDDR